MYIIGIDIGKNHHEASIVSPEGKQIGRSLRFATTHKGADSLMRFIFKNIGNSPCVFGMEATGHYWYPIYSFLKAKRYTIYVINPIQSDSLRKMYIRQTKNDSIDSFLIAEVIRFGQFGTTSMADENILAMRQLCRYRDSVISSRTEIKLRIGTIMEQIFPEYEKQFSSLWVSTSMGILEKYLTPENIENAPIDELFEIIKDKSHNRLTRAKAISIKEAAADTFGIKIAQDAFSFQLKQLIDRMNFLDKQIEALDIEIMKYYPHDRLVLCFQPHTYSRTKAFLNDFADVLSMADVVVLADIYAAREQNTYGISSKDILDLLLEKGVNAHYFPSFEEIEKFLSENCVNGDLLITMGAGNVVEIGEDLLKK